MSLSMPSLYALPMLALVSSGYHVFPRHKNMLKSATVYISVISTVGFTLCTKFLGDLPKNLDQSVGDNLAWLKTEG